MIEARKLIEQVVQGTEPRTVLSEDGPRTPRFRDVNDLNHAVDKVRAAFLGIQHHMAEVSYHLGSMDREISLHTSDPVAQMKQSVDRKNLRALWEAFDKMQEAAKEGAQAGTKFQTDLDADFGPVTG